MNFTESLYNFIEFCLYPLIYSLLHRLYVIVIIILSNNIIIPDPHILKFIAVDDVYCDGYIYCE